MAKKVPKRAKQKVEQSGRVEVKLRIEREVFEEITQLAEKAEISVNQLMNGLAKFASDNGHVGEPELVKVGDAVRFFSVKKQPGVVYFGEQWRQWQSQEEREEVATEAGCEVKDLGEFSNRGKFYFMLDFTVRRVIREE